jgi:flagellar basal body-associated protein FliL
MRTIKRKKASSSRYQGILWILLSLLVVLLFLNASCTMFLIKEGVKEVKKLEEEKKEKNAQQQWQNEQLTNPDGATRGESTECRHHGQWTPSREE